MENSDSLIAEIESLCPVYKSHNSETTCVLNKHHIVTIVDVCNIYQKEKILQAIADECGYDGGTVDYDKVIRVISGVE